MSSSQLLRIAMRRAAKIGGTSFVAVTGVSSAATLYAYQTDESWKRLIDFHILITPMMWDYTKHWYYYSNYNNNNTSSQQQSPESSHHQQQQKQELEELHEKYAPRTLQHVLELGGYYVKCAQMFCGMNLLPEAYEKEFAILLDKVPPRHSFATIRSIIEEELGGVLEDHFVDFDPIPIAAASIGQVHCAKIRSSDGRLQPVVVKIQYPEVERYFHLDVLSLKNLCHLCTWMGIDIGIDQASLDKVFGEFTNSFREEFDYRLEAQNMTLVGNNLQAVPQFVGRIKVPKAYTELTTRKVLTMERLVGEPIQKRMNRQLEEYAKRQGKTVQQLQQDLQTQFQDPQQLQKLMEQKPPTAFQLSLYKGMLRAYDYGTNLKIWFSNQLTAQRKQQPYQWSTLPLNAASICNLLFQVHAHQLFVNGAFNADPHAGNILICDDDNGTLGLIDFGNVQRIESPQRRLALAKLYLAMSQDISSDPSSWNDEEIANRFASVLQGQEENGSSQSNHYSRTFLACNALTMYDMRLDTATLARFGIKPDMANIMDVVYGEESFDEFPADLVNLQRLCQTLVGVAGLIGAGRPSCSQMWKQHCQILVQDSS